MGWKILKSKKDIINPGIFQEKLIVCCASKGHACNRLMAQLRLSHPDAEECDVPEEILALFPASFGYWVNKHNPSVSEKDIKQGNIRMKI